MDTRSDGEQRTDGRDDAEDVLAFLRAALGIVFRADEDIFESGAVTSLFALELVVHVESRYGIQIGPEDLDLDNFRSAERIHDLIRRKRAAAPPAGS